MGLTKIKAADFVEVRKSTTHGIGAFAALDIAKGTEIGYYRGKRYGKKAAARMNWKASLTYIFGLSDGSSINGSEKGNNLRRLNHSCAPNCEAFEVEDDDGKLHIVFSTKKKIKKGDELFIDYSLDIDGRNPAKFACRCDAKNCRGTMADPSTLET